MINNNGTTPLLDNDNHSFHIPVMGTGFTIDTPIRVAKYGITSVISIGDDMLQERIRKYYCGVYNRQFKPIGIHEKDQRARRITAYLNLVKELVEEETESLRLSPFQADSEITKYFELLPEGELKSAYIKMQECSDPETKRAMQDDLRSFIRPGRIDVNIMSKLDKDKFIDGQPGNPEDGVAMSAIRGFAQSDLNSAIVLSAGINRRLYAYMPHFEDFFPQNGNLPQKAIILKVSDYRSARLQGKMLTRLGLWVTEFRVESGLNCGGHAFATAGELLGPILDEFKNKRAELEELLRRDLDKAFKAQGRPQWNPPRLRVTAQGGVGTATEHNLLLEKYDVDSVGWGSPFLLVPEATNVDVLHLKKLIMADEEDTVLSNSSPLGIPFWNLRTSTSEQIRTDRISSGHPGSFCPKGYLAMDFEFNPVPLCTAAKKYQEQKLKQLSDADISFEKKTAMEQNVIAKTCLCTDLAAGALNRLGLTSHQPSAICCGPNMAYYSKVATLKEMADHIYGRASLLSCTDRPHMFLKELSLYIDNLQNELERVASGLMEDSRQRFAKYRENLQSGIEYYRQCAAQIDNYNYQRFIKALDEFAEKVLNINIDNLAMQS